MKVIRRGTSGDVIDQRGGGGRSGVPLAIGGGLSIPALILAAIAYFVLGQSGGSGFGINMPLDQLPGAQVSGKGIPADQDPNRDQVEFVSFVLDDIQQFWTEQFASSGSQYQRAKLVLFDGQVSTACGGATSDVGPFYCPGDQQVYIDLGFFRELSQRFGAPGDFAQAYVIAHEVGHHVQKLTGISADVANAQRKKPNDANELSVRLELQADCLAGVWAHSTYQRDILESGDLEEGLAAAAAVGDDRLQKQAGQRVNPETWTHGSSQDRVNWFKKGFETGKASACDTFAN